MPIEFLIFGFVRFFDPDQKKTISIITISNEFYFDKV